MKKIRAAPAVVIIAKDLPESFGQVRSSYECDCACPSTTQVAHSQLSSTLVNEQRVIRRSPNLVEVPLNGDYTALFNPFSQGGVVVTNQAALEVLERFEHPTSIAAVQRSGIDNLDGAINKLFFAGILQEDANYNFPDFKGSDVLSVWLQVTNACNLSCSYCYIRKDGQSMTAETGRAALEAVFHSAQTHAIKMVRVKYSGGEPSLKGPLVLMLHDYARELARSSGIEFQDVLLSNGVSLSAQFIQELKAREIRVMVSLDGVESFHDVQRLSASGYGSYARVRQTIENLLEAGLPPHLSITITGRNLAGLPEVVRYALANNLTFSFNFYRETIPGDNLLRYNEPAMIEALRKAFAVIEEGLPTWSMLGMILDRGQLLEPRQRTCGAGKNYIVIDHLGRIAQCHMVMEKTLGDVYTEDPLAAIRQSDHLQNTLVDERDGCRECQWRYWCTGGCPILAQHLRGDSAGCSPNCNIYQAIYPEAIRLEGLRLLKYANASLH